MARIMVVNDFPEVVVCISRILTPGHEILTRNAPIDWSEWCQHPPDVIILVIFRTLDSIGRPLESFEEDVCGGATLREINAYPELLARPIVVFGIGVRPDEIPSDLRYHSFLTFPQAIQELSPLISGLVGPAPQREERSAP